MPLGAHRLLLSVSAMRRALGGVTADHLLTQAGDVLIAQDGRLILANQSNFSTGADEPGVADQELSILLTQTGEFISTQAGQLLGAEQLFTPAALEGAAKFITTQDLNQLITQDGEFIIEDVFAAADLLTAQSGDFLITQGLDNIAL
jgi:hypothetical protein